MSANVQEETTYRCVGALCGRALPRRVNFCPWCGTPQHAGAVHAAARVAPEAAAPAPVVVLDKAAEPAAVPDVEWGAAPHAARVDAGAPAAATAAPARPVARAPVPARPPEREPVRLRWWLLALAVLWMIWTYERPAPKKIDARIDRAIGLAADCKAREAQSELIALRRTDATPEQLERLQQALNDAAAACTRSRQRGR